METKSKFAFICSATTYSNLLCLISHFDRNILKVFRFNHVSLLRANSIFYFDGTFVAIDDRLTHNGWAGWVSERKSHLVISSDLVIAKTISFVSQKPQTVFRKIIRIVLKSVKDFNSTVVINRLALTLKSHVSRSVTTLSSFARNVRILPNLRAHECMNLNNSDSITKMCFTRLSTKKQLNRCLLILLRDE